LVSGKLRELIFAYRAEFPEIALQLREASSREQLIALRERNVDVAFLVRTNVAEGADTLELWRERAYLVLPAGHPIAGQPSITLDELSMEQFIVRGSDADLMNAAWLFGRFSVNARDVRITPHNVSRDTLIGMVGAGFGLAVVCEAAAQTLYPHVIFRPIAPADAEIPITLAWLPDNDNPALRRFVSFVRTFAFDKVHDDSGAD